MRSHGLADDPTEGLDALGIGQQVEIELDHGPSNSSSAISKPAAKSL
jgi:hypothetical protein